MCVCVCRGRVHTEGSRAGVLVLCVCVCVCVGGVFTLKALGFPLGAALSVSQSQVPWFPRS